MTAGPVATTLDAAGRASLFTHLLELQRAGVLTAERIEAAAASSVGQPNR
jgi:hypothetical protein